MYDLRCLIPLVGVSCRTLRRESADSQKLYTRSIPHVLSILYCTRTTDVFTAMTFYFAAFHLNYCFFDYRHSGLWTLRIGLTFAL